MNARIPLTWYLSLASLSGVGCLCGNRWSYLERAPSVGSDMSGDETLEEGEIHDSPRKMRRQTHFFLLRFFSQAKKGNPWEMFFRESESRFRRSGGNSFDELWFQQDGATCHTARATTDLLKDTFGDRLISCFGPVNWPPRSCGLTPLVYFLWGYVKSLVYVDKPQTLDHLEDNIRRVIADIRPQISEKVIENWTSRLDYIRASRGSPMQDIIFKM
ncbi:uncharacterized protein TNCV_3919111 [Trichonephila clavipes]|nr:uncharacterized protein TNCV_3919111 [Trichonephila clavipes]